MLSKGVHNRVHKPSQICIRLQYKWIYRNFDFTDLMINNILKKSMDDHTKFLTDDQNVFILTDDQNVVMTWTMYVII